MRARPRRASSCYCRRRVSGKTNTLAHRVAHFIVNGADPRRILLMTFLPPSRRRDDPPGGADMLPSTWGPIRGHHDWRSELGPVPFTASEQGSCANMPNRSASIPALPSTTAKTPADLMNLVRHPAWTVEDRKAGFPTKGTCLAIYSRAVNAELPLGEVLGGFFPWCAGWEKPAARAVRSLCRGKAKRRTSSIMTICCSTGRKQ